MKCMIIIYVFNNFDFEVLEMKLRALRMPGKHSTPDLNLSPLRFVLFLP